MVPTMVAGGVMARGARTGHEEGISSTPVWDERVLAAGPRV